MVDYFIRVYLFYDGIIYIKPKVGVKYVIGAIPKMEAMYVRRFKKIRTFPTSKAL